MRGGLALVVALCVAAVAAMLPLARAKCTASTTPPGTYTVRNGTIMSDTDGRGPERYEPFEDCVWRIQCPANHSVALYQIAVSLSSSSALEIIDGYQASNTIRRLSWGTSTLRVLLPMDRVTLRFTSGSMTSGAGVTVSYFCVPGTCSAREYNYGNFTSGRNFSGAAAGVVSSGVGGGGDDVAVDDGGYLGNERCEWNIHCDARHNATALRVVVHHQLVSSDELTLGGTSLTVRGSGTTRAFLPINSSGDVRVHFEAPRSATLWSAARGFTAEYRCVPAMCSAADGGGGAAAAAALTQRAGSFGSDEDGEGARPYYFWEQCQWRVECPPSHAASIAVGIRGRLGGLAAVTVTNVADNATVLEVDRSGLFTQHGLVAGSGAALVSFTTEDGATSNGFTAEYMCHSGLCSSLSPGLPGGDDGSADPDKPDDPAFFTGEIESDGDGAGAHFQYAAGEACTWAIVCPASRGGGIVVAAWGHLDSAGDELAVDVSLEGASAPEPRVVLNLRDIVVSEANPATRWFTRGVGVGRANATVRFSSVAAGQGFTLRYLCLQAQQPATAAGSTPQCSSTNATTVTHTGEMGVVLSDVDGAGTATPYFKDELCAFRISCPAAAGELPFTTMRLDVEARLAGTTTSLDVLRAGSDAALVSFPFDAPLTSTEFVDATDVVARFRSGNAAVSGGVTLAWRCMVHKCTSETAGETFAASSGRILSDADGAGTRFTYQSGEHCMWRVRCPGNATHVRFTVETRTGSAEDRVYIRAAGAGEDAYTQGGPGMQSGRVFYLDSPSADVGFITESTVTQGAGGALIDYECVTNMCSIAEQRMTGVSGVLSSDADGPGHRDRIGRGDRCMHSVACPAGYSYLAIDGTVWLAISGTGVTVTNSDGSDALAVTSTSRSAYAGVLRTNGERVVFFINATAASAPYGFRFEWRCHTYKCASVSEPRAELTPARPSAEFAVANQQLFRGSSAGPDNCTWAVRCPSGTEALFLRSVGSFRRTLDAWQVSAEPLSGGAPRVVAAFGSQNTSAQGSVLQLVANVTGVTGEFTAAAAAGAGSSGYSASWLHVCSPSRCQSRSSGSVYRWNASAGQSDLISSRVDGDTLTAEGEVCEWEIQCESSEYVRLRSVSLRLGGNYFIVRDMTVRETGTIIGLSADRRPPWRVLREETRSRSMPRMNLASSHVTIVLQGVMPWSTSRTGLSFRFECVPVECNSVATPTQQVHTARSGRIMSDTDGVGSAGSAVANQWCQWGIRCPAGLGAVYTSANLAFPRPSWPDNGAQVLLQTANATGLRASPMQLVNYFQAMPMIFFIKAPVVVDFTTADGAVDGFTMDYHCVTDTCLLANWSAQAPTSILRPSDTLSLRLTAEGLERTGISRHSSCQWRVMCPERQKAGGGSDRGAIAVTIDGFFNSSSTLMLNSDRIATTSSTMLIDDGDVNISASGHFGPFENQTTVAFQCMESLCPATSPPTHTYVTSKGGYGSRGTIRTWNTTDRSLTGRRGHMAGVRCEWYVDCPPESRDDRRVEFVISGNIGLGYLYFDRVRGSTIRRRFRSFRRTQDSEKYSTSDRSWILRFETSSAEQLAEGFTVEYDCSAVIPSRSSGSSATASSTYELPFPKPALSVIVISATILLFCCAVRIPRFIRACSGSKRARGGTSQTSSHALPFPDTNVNPVSLFSSHGGGGRNSLDDVARRYRMTLNQQSGSGSPQLSAPIYTGTGDDFGGSGSSSDEECSREMDLLDAHNFRARAHAGGGGRNVTFEPSQIQWTTFGAASGNSNR